MTKQISNTCHTDYAIIFRDTIALLLDKLVLMLIFLKKTLIHG